MSMCNFCQTPETVPHLYFTHAPTLLCYVWVRERTRAYHYAHVTPERYYEARRENQGRQHPNVTPCLRLFVNLYYLRADGNTECEPRRYLLEKFITHIRGKQVPFNVCSEQNLTLTNKGTFPQYKLSNPMQILLHLLMCKLFVLVD